MVRARIPAGRLTAAQYLALDALADRYGNATLRITTRQSIQFHGVLQDDLKPTIAEINRVLLTTLAGLRRRGAQRHASPHRSATPCMRACRPMRECSPARCCRRRARYHEIFARRGAADRPRRRSRSTAPPTCHENSRSASRIPADNTVDVLTNDLGLIALFEGDGCSATSLASAAASA